ncbi:MAG: hypothetical protein LBV52_02870, partial [Spirochaetaceae bacterium]|nr:hypothetical protein [Spirochaetaceae bacterium]
LEAGTFRAELFTTDFSGGVLNPVISNGNIFYKGSFSVWDAFMKYPETASIKKEFKSVRWNDALSSLALAATSRDADLAEPLLTKSLPDGVKEKSYHPIKYFNPFKLWVPYPVINPIVSSIYYDGTAAFKAAGNFRNLHFDGAGLFFFASDPTDDNLFFVNAAYDGHYNTALVGLTWYNFSLTMPIIINLKDTVDEADELNVLRIVNAGISTSKRIPLGNERRALTLGGSFSSWWYFYQDSFERKTTKTQTAYQWNLHQQFFTYAANATLSNIKKFQWETFGSGLSNQAYLGGIIDINKIKNAAGKLRYADVFTASIEELPFLQKIPVMSNFSFNNVVYGLYDKNGINIYGRSLNFSGTIFDASAPTEYKTFSSYPLTWMIGGEADWKIFAWEIQNNISHVYFNRLSIGAAYRWAYYGNQNMRGTSQDAQNSNNLHSALLKSSLAVSVAPIKVVPIKITFNVFGALKLSALKKGNTRDDFEAGFSVGAQY